MGWVAVNCPACGQSVDLAPVVKDVGICGNCLASLVIGETPRRATAADTVSLTVEQLAALRKARKTAREAQV